MPQRLRAQPSVQSRGGGHSFVSLVFPKLNMVQYLYTIHVPPKVYGGYAHGPTPPRL